MYFYTTNIVPNGHAVAIGIAAGMPACRHKAYSPGRRHRQKHKNG